MNSQSSDGPKKGAPALDEALRCWKKTIGEENVVDSREQLSTYSESTLPSSHSPVAVLRPCSTEEVVDIVEIASTFGVPLYPISRGKNWGYGDTCPTSKGQVVVDLGRMNRIVELNDELAYAVVEPGVTQAQLADEIKRRTSSLLLDVTGAGPEASIIGNTLERGFGHTPSGDHFAHSSCFEVVLGDGTIVSTGFGGYPKAKSAHVFPAGLGPSMDGIFTQSNFGIVTRMTISLMRRPEKIVAFALQLPREGDLEATVNTLRLLRQKGVLRSTVHIANDLRLISALMSCPEEERQNGHALSDETRRQLRKKTGTGVWNLLGGLYGDRDQIRWAKKTIRKHFSKFASPIFFEESTIKLWKKCAAPFKRFEFGQAIDAKIQSAQSALDLLSGIPTREHLRGAFWRNSLAPEQMDDPVNAGLMWVSPVIPMDGTSARHLMSIIEPVMQSYGFDPLATLTAINERSLCGVISINFDRSNQEESERAGKCYDDLWSRLTREGYLPYRCGTQSMAKVGQENLNLPALRKIKDALDPQGILSPGRYGL